MIHRAPIGTKGIFRLFRAPFKPCRQTDWFILSVHKRPYNTKYRIKLPPTQLNFCVEAVINRIPVTAPILAPLFGLYYSEKHIFLKNRALKQLSCYKRFHAYFLLVKNTQ
jgi:hypothetical protein